MPDEKLPEQSAGMKQPARIISSRQVVVGEAQPPAFNQYGDGIADCMDFEFFGSPANFRPISQQIQNHLRKKQ